MGGRPGKSSAARPPAPQGWVGLGEYDEETGLYEEYRKVEAGPIRWARILEHWRLIEQDLADRGVDLATELPRRSWRWLEVRIEGLFNGPPAFAADGTPLPTSRLGWALRPPKREQDG